MKAIKIFKNKTLVQPAVQHGLAIAAAKIIGVISFLPIKLGYAGYASQLTRRYWYQLT